MSLIWVIYRNMDAQLLRKTWVTPMGDRTIEGIKKNLDSATVSCSMSGGGGGHRGPHQDGTLMEKNLCRSPLTNHRC